MRIERFLFDDTTVVTVTTNNHPHAAPPEVCAVVGGVAPSSEQLAQIQRGHAQRLAPCAPSKIVCIGLNFRRHAEEMGKALPAEPVVFLKPTTAIVSNNDAIVLPAQSNDVQFEGELAVVIGKRATRVLAADAMQHVLGYTIMNDVTARDLQRADMRYTRAKGFDSFAPLGPAIVAGLDPNALRIETRVNGELRQNSGCDDFIFSLSAIIEYVSNIMTLLPGDVISTGTPAGVGTLHAGDVVSVTIEPIGTLQNPVVALR